MSTMSRRRSIHDWAITIGAARPCVDRNLERIEARLRARFGRNGVATGTLEVAGRTIRVRCEEA
jgi:hypothetical protein